MSLSIEAGLPDRSRLSPSIRPDDHNHRRQRRIAASAGAGVIQRLLQVASSFILMPVLLKVLGPAQFGIWGAAASLAWMSGLADLGTGAALVTLVARSNALGDTEAARRHIAGALSCGLVFAGVMILLAAGAWGLGIPAFGSNLALIAFVSLAVNVPLSAANNIWMALQKGHIAGFWELVQTIITTGALLTAATTIAPLWVYVAIVYVGIVLSNLASLIHLFWRHPELRPRGFLAPMAATREVARQGMMYFAMGLAGGLGYLLDNVLALTMLGPEASARMVIASRICVTAVGGFVVLSQPLWPAFAEASESGDQHWIRKALLRGSTLLVGVTLAGSVILLSYGGRLLHWWLHGNLEISKGLLWAIAAWILSQALVRVPHLLLNGLSVVRFQIVVFSMTTMAAFGLKFALMHSLGEAGILWGTTVSVLLIAFPFLVFRSFRSLRHPAPHGDDLLARIASEPASGSYQ